MILCVSKPWFSTQRVNPRLRLIAGMGETHKIMTVPLQALPVEISAVITFTFTFDFDFDFDDGSM